MVIKTHTVLKPGSLIALSGKAMQHVQQMFINNSVQTWQDPDRPFDMQPDPKEPSAPEDDSESHQPFH